MAARRALAAKLILAAVGIGVAAAATVPSLRPTAAPSVPTPAAPPVRAAIASPPPTPEPRPVARPTPNPLIVKRVLDIGPIKFGDYTWDDAGVPAGPLIVTVDLAAQTLSVFRDGYEIGATAILYGADDKPTPLGSFPILMKDAHHVSSLYGAPMPYTMRLTNDGVAVHGTEVAWGYATHGCIGVPTAFAKLLFREAKVGDRVIITRGKTLATGETLVS
ncbi:L,D-transpeptidase family protein [Sphingomonas taxi]|uniref:L,D-transpeptidase family protein n=1 Tax=Sphingomonas taxi TaxID=1549858 RepID=UPI0015D0176C|nr:L,D-transpeptidase family protein [Sphingomonas taxi]